MNEKNFVPEARPEKKSFDEAFEELQEILSVLQELGLTVPEFCTDRKKIQRDWEGKYPFPIARDGVDGVRAVRVRNTGRFRVMFTNGFEDPDDLEHIRIVDALQEKGFDVVDMRR